ncbi:hypothetical protein B0T10DRAFT_497762 [Thelonectria olida]|uniref:F-box domain-containing protein n=1 Tax=Thelonectria olida TaxID=1576542 RepID=A0A9P8VU59_9HYPO|nr:hypothetical protein B0T10DRAFT_497762 [Thelonectria olida]
MGYSEVECHICGVSFNISRFRTSTEPRSAAWKNTGDGVSDFVDANTLNGSFCSKKSGCSFVPKPKPQASAAEGEDSAGGGDHDNDDDSWEDVSDEDDSGDDDYQDGSENGDDQSDESDAHSDTHSERLYSDFRSSVVQPPMIDAGPSEKAILSFSEEEKTNKTTDPADDDEHIAGPGCESTNGYNGHLISAEAMRGCNTLQCLVRKKRPQWAPIPDDEEFETEGDFFLSGLCDNMPSRDIACPVVFPTRHNCEEPSAENSMWNPEDADDYAMPFHPTCLEVFKRASLFRYGVVDIDCLAQWWGLEATYDEFQGFPRDDAISREQWWHHIRGDEWLAANPCLVPGLKSILSSAQYSNKDDEHREGVNLDAFTNATPSNDEFSRLPSEIRLMILMDLGSKDIANLRLASRTFRQLPGFLFHDLIMRETPWLYEAWSPLPLSFWATTTASELKKKDKADHAERERYRESLRVLQKEAREARQAGEPAGLHSDAIAAIEKQIAAIPYDSDSPRPTTSVPLLDQSSTDWYRLLTALAQNRKSLPGLRNRRRIWKDCHEILDRVDKYRRQGKITPGKTVDVAETCRLARERKIEGNRRWRRYCDAGRPGVYNPDDWA